MLIFESLDEYLTYVELKKIYGQLKFVHIA